MLSGRCLEMAGDCGPTEPRGLGAAAGVYAGGARRLRAGTCDVAVVVVAGRRQSMVRHARHGGHCRLVAANGLRRGATLEGGLELRARGRRGPLHVSLAARREFIRRAGRGAGAHGIGPYPRRRRRAACGVPARRAGQSLLDAGHVPAGRARLDWSRAAAAGGLPCVLSGAERSAGREGRFRTSGQRHVVCRGAWHPHDQRLFELVSGRLGPGRARPTGICRRRPQVGESRRIDGLCGLDPRPARWTVGLPD